MISRHILVLVLLVPLHAVCGELLLVEDAAPKASIVVPQAASPTERFAAEELRRYIKEISGA